MGKKSKKNAGGGSKGKGSVSTETNGGATTYCDGTGGCGILTSGGGTSSKKNRCVLCCALLKDLAKAHACPGCSLLYCWRCERKSFASCPNGDRCVRPVVRCESCRSGDTMERELVAAGALGPNEKMTIADHGTPATRKAYQEIVDSRADVTDDSWPLVVCGARLCTSYTDKTFEEVLALMECIHCASAAANNLLSCHRCKKIRCRPCTNRSRRTAAMDAFDLVTANSDEAKDLAPETIVALQDCLSTGSPDSMAKCHSCSRVICYECRDFVETKLTAEMLLRTANGIFEPEKLFHCSSCYWSVKPCTNPNCPNEVGIPTKRCGGCHLDRYCSVECQAIMHSDHMGRCQRIQEKRATAEKDLREKE